jgi:hypothetical protein
MERLQQIYDDAGAPGAQAFRFAVRRAGLQISEVEAKSFVAKQSTGQLMQRRIPSDGVVPSGGKDSARAQADLVDFSKRITRINKGNKYVLVVIDLYDRQLFTVPMKSKSANETLQAWKKVIQSNGGVQFAEVTVDLGNEFSLLGQELESKGSVLRKKDLRQANTLSVVDRAIGKLKKLLANYDLSNWANSLKRATLAHNENSHDKLMGSAPNDVKTSPELQYQIEADHGKEIKHNNDKWRNRVGRLRDAGAFRTALPRGTWARIDAPKFSGGTFNVDGFKGSHVESGGTSYPVKTSLAVPVGSADVDIGIETGPGAGRRARQKEMLQDFGRKLKDLLPTSGYTLKRVAQILTGMRGWEDTTAIYGPAKQGRIGNFLKLYPRWFAIQGTGPGIKVFPAEPVPVARPVQVGGASSSGPAERQPRAPEIDPRAPYRKFPNDQKVEYGDNPARATTPRHRRYEKYRMATTIGQARRLGATSQDISLDIQNGALKLL